MDRFGRNISTIFSMIKHNFRMIILPDFYLSMRLFHCLWCYEEYKAARKEMVDYQTKAQY